MRKLLSEQFLGTDKTRFSLFPGNRNCSVYGCYKDNSAVWGFMVSSMHVQYFEPHISATQILYITAIGCHGTPFFCC